MLDKDMLKSAITVIMFIIVQTVAGVWWAATTSSNIEVLEASIEAHGEKLQSIEQTNNKLLERTGGVMNVLEIMQKQIETNQRRLSQSWRQKLSPQNNERRPGNYPFILPFKDYSIPAKRTEMEKSP